MSEVQASVLPLVIASLDRRRATYWLMRTTGFQAGVQAAIRRVLKKPVTCMMASAVVGSLSAKSKP